MKILVIGGTSFIGLHLVEQALDRGHEVTMFNRGRTNPAAFPGVERLAGDRERTEDVSILGGREWDAVVDTCGFDHRVVARSSEWLGGRVGHYTFVSSIAVYADLSRSNTEEDARLGLEGDLDNPIERPYGGSSLYGPMKVRCEEIIARAFPDRWLVVRPTSVAGPGDHGASNRRTAYWAARVRDYDEFIVPRPRDRPVSYIDVRDLAAWMISSIEHGVSGAFNAAAPSLTIDRFLEITRDLYGRTARAVWADPEWLLSQAVKPNVELPWWVPDEPNLFAVDASKARAAGLQIRPIEQTIRDSADWEDVRPNTFAPQSKYAGQARGALLDRARELRLLELWRARLARAMVAAR
jgi:nucleoside-diphosphate-sugar epimerase